MQINFTMVNYIENANSLNHRHTRTHAQQHSKPEAIDCAKICSELYKSILKTSL